MNRKKKRREFLKKLTAFSILSYNSGLIEAKSTLLPFTQTSGSKKIKIGIIGAENSHTIAFGKMFNIDKSFPGVSVVSVWGETKELAQKAMKEGNIPKAVEHPEDMLGTIDALIVAHRHAKYHLDAALPFIKAGIPTFIDKPFCYRVKNGMEFLKLARRLGTPVTSYSLIAHRAKTFDIKNKLSKHSRINNIVSYGPVDIDSPYGGIFFYGVHLVQPLLYIFDDDIIKVKVSRHNTFGSANLVFKNGLFATLVFRSLSKGWTTFAETEKGILELKSDATEPSPKIAYSDMVEMFRSGKEPRSHDNIIKCVATLEALEKSSKTEKWEFIEV